MRTVDALLLSREAQGLRYTSMARIFFSVVGLAAILVNPDEFAHSLYFFVVMLMQHAFRGRISILKEYGTIPKIGCRPAEINQVFYNVLTNAVEAIREQGTITIRTRMEAPAVVIQIADTGVGIAPERLQRIFNPDFTAQGPRVKAALELFTCYNILQNHHGDLQIESQPGAGTTVTIRLPAGLR